MSYSAVQLIAISGLLQNTGLGVNTRLVAQLDNMQNTIVITGKLRRVAVHPNVSTLVLDSMRTTLPGICMVAPVTYTSLSAAITAVDITESIRTRADQFFLRGVNGYLGIVSRADADCQMSRDILGAVYSYDGTSFSSVNPDVTKHIDLATGGLSSKFGPLARNSEDYRRASGLYSAGVGSSGVITSDAVDIERSIRAVGEGIRRLGTLYNLFDLATLGTPAGLIKSLYTQGLLSTKFSGRTGTTDADFIEALLSEGITLTNIDTANQIVLTDLLTKVTDPIFINKVITATGLIVPSGVVITNAGDFLKANKVMPNNAVGAIPYGTLYQLGQQLLSLNISYSTSDALVEALLTINVPSHEILANLTRPVPSDEIAVIRDAVPSGTGDFSSCKIQELIGTPSGYVHLDSLETIALVASKLSSTTEGLTLISAADAVYAKYAADLSATVEEAALISAIDSLAAVTDYKQNIESTNIAISNCVNQIELEIANCNKTGLDIYSTIPGNNNIITTITSFPSFGVDNHNSGIKDMLIDTTTIDKYGEAIKACLIQGQNDKILQTIGTKNIGIPDIASNAKKYQFESGQTTLTIQQRENVIADARAQQLLESDAIRNAELYGYNNQYYVSRGYPVA
jgi:hypothetical protein